LISPFAGTVEEIVSMVFRFFRMGSFSLARKGRDKSARAVRNLSVRLSRIVKLEFITSSFDVNEIPNAVNFADWMSLRTVPSKAGIITSAW
jgi:hypothetical protein